MSEVRAANILSILAGQKTKQPKQSQSTATNHAGQEIKTERHVSTRKPKIAKDAP